MKLFAMNTLISKYPHDTEYTVTQHNITQNERRVHCFAIGNARTQFDVAFVDGVVAMPTRLLVVS